MGRLRFPKGVYCLTRGLDVGADAGIGISICTVAGGKVLAGEVSPPGFGLVKRQESLPSCGAGMGGRWVGWGARVPPQHLLHQQSSAPALGVYPLAAAAARMPQGGGAPGAPPSLSPCPTSDLIWSFVPVPCHPATLPGAGDGAGGSCGRQLPAARAQV